MKTSAATAPQDVRTEMERVYKAWDAAIAAGDISSLVELYAPEADIESPLIWEFTHGKTGVLRGRAAFHALYEEVARRQSNVIRPRHHDDYLLRGRRIVWEYPRVSASGERSEFIESWDFNERFEILAHRVYWGWSRIATLSHKGFAAPAARQD